MNDAMKAGGIMGGVGVAGAVLLLAHRVYTDNALTWVVVGGGMLCLVLMLAALWARQMRATWEARAAVLRLQNESSLIGARAVRTLDGVQSRPAANDFLGQMIAGMQGPDVVDQPGTSLAWPDDGHDGGGQ